MHKGVGKTPGFSRGKAIVLSTQNSQAILKLIHYYRQVRLAAVPMEFLQ